MINQIIEQSKAFLILQQDSALFVTRKKEKTFIKQIDLASLIESISQSDFESDWHISPLLKLHHITQKRAKITTISSILPNTYLLKFESFKIKVPLPGTIVKHCQDQLWVYAYKGKLDIDSTLYHYPLPNIDTDAKVCWGNIVQSKSNPSCAWQAFVESEFNQDYDDNKSKIHPDNIVTQLKSVAQDLVYPEQDLVPTNFTLTDFTR